jgi:hypothetical protein
MAYTPPPKAKEMVAKASEQPKVYKMGGSADKFGRRPSISPPRPRTSVSPPRVFKPMEKTIEAPKVYKMGGSADKMGRPRTSVSPGRTRDIPMKVTEKSPEPRMMGGDKSTWAPRPKISMRRISPSPPKVMESKSVRAPEPRVHKMGGSPSKMGGSTWPLPRASVSPPRTREAVSKKIERSPEPRMVGGDKSTWAPRPKLEMRRISPSPPRVMEKSVSAPEPRVVTMGGSASKMGGNSSTWGLTNSKAAIHDDIRRMARRIEHEPPTMKVMKHEMKISSLPTIEEADKDSEI